MTKREYVAKVYEILEKKGHIEINGELYYPESAIVDAMDWVRENSSKIVEIDTAKMLADLTNRLSNSITGNS